MTNVPSLPDLPASTRLRDLGERRIIHDVLGTRYSSSAPNFGDDCVVVQLADTNLVVTTDPCPEPAAAYLGFDDWYYRGWLLGTLNLSDLGAAGATPIGFITDYELPDSTLLSDFVRFLEGLDDCLHRHGTKVLGGNIKESSSLSLSATAFGLAAHLPSRRHNAEAGDKLFLVGQSGDFWAGVLTRRSFPNEAPEDSEVMRPVLRPVPQLAAGSSIASSNLAKSITDNSDGLYTSLLAISLGQSFGFHLALSDDLVTAKARDVGRRIGIDPVRLLLGWGDWQLIVVASTDDARSMEALLNEIGCAWCVLGEVTGEPGVTASYNGAHGQLLPLDSQRFAPDSWMSSGLEGYIESLVGAPLLT